MGVGRQDLAQLAGTLGAEELLDEGRRGGEARLEVVLDGSVATATARWVLPVPLGPQDRLAKGKCARRRQRLGAVGDFLGCQVGVSSWLPMA